METAIFGQIRSLITDYEMQGTGVQWDNIAQSPNYGDPFCLGYALIMLFFDAILYLVLTLYIEQVLPGKYGVPRKWYYLCQTSTYKKMQIDTDDASFDPNFKLQVSSGLLISSQGFGSAAIMIPIKLVLLFSFLITLNNLNLIPNNPNSNPK